MDNQQKKNPKHNLDIQIMNMPVLGINISNRALCMLDVHSPVDTRNQASILVQ